MVRTAGDANAGLLLADILRWFRLPEDDHQLARRYRPVDVNGQPWLAKTIAGFVMETGLTDSQVSGALKRLRTNNLIERNGRLDLLRPTCSCELTPSRGVRVYARLVHLTRSAAQGIILSQLHYWFSPGPDQRARVRNQHQDHWWWAATYEEIASQTGLSLRATRTAVDSLKRRGLIQVDVFRFRGRNSLHLRFVDAAFYTAWRNHFYEWLALQHDERYQGHVEL